MEFLLKESFESADFFSLPFAPKPAGGAVTPSHWSDGADGWDVCVWTEFTFRQCSACHGTLGAIDKAVAFPVVPQCTQF